MIWTGADYLRAVGIEHDYKKEVLARTIVELEKELEEASTLLHWTYKWYCNGQGITGGFEDVSDWVNRNPPKPKEKEC